MSEQTILEKIRKKASSKNRSVVLPEAGIDIRVIKAAIQISSSGIAKPILISSNGDLAKLAEESGIGIPEEITVMEAGESESLAARKEYLREQMKHKNPTEEQLDQLAGDRLVAAGWLVATGEADCAVAGSVGSTASVIRGALRTIGVAKDSKMVSSIFLMELQDGRVLTYGDCAVIPYPDAGQLADIALTSARSHSQLTGEEPRVAFLSFSTKGSAAHERVDLVKEALEIARKNSSGLALDGELQFDAAFLPSIAERKAPGSSVAGHANVMIFPNLDAGNIGYKITERVGGAKAVGPILQGLAKPYMDLSRGCSVDDIVDTASVAILLS